jgi:hypothetical protein
MKLDDVRAELESELTWRVDELRHLTNALDGLSLDPSKDKFRKALIVILYSHLEGFAKAAFSIYAKAVNSLRVKCGDADEFLAAATFGDVFDAYENRDKKCRVFKKALPDDSGLHRYARQVDFIVQMNEFMSRDIRLDADRVVEVESNLWPIVLKKILYRLGLPLDSFSEQEGTLWRLVSKRNNVAHGVERGGIASAEYQELHDCAFEIMQTIIQVVSDALRNKIYLRGSLSEHNRI